MHLSRISMKRGGSEKHTPVAPDGSGVRVHVFRDIPADGSYVAPHFFEFQNIGGSFTAEELCMRVSRELGIGSLAYQVFALQTFDKTPVWLPPNEEIHCNEDQCCHLQFRLRFLPPQDQMLALANGLDEAAFNYFFLQCRNDFVNDKVTYDDGKLGQDRALGLAISDIVRYSKEYNISQSDVSSRLKPKYFIPNSEKAAFKNLLSKFKLNLNLKTHIDSEMFECRGMPLVQLKFRYIYDGLLMYAPGYGVEEYTTDDGCILRIQPHDEKHPGFNIIDRSVTGEAHVETFARIEDLMDIVFNDKSKLKILINRKNGSPRNLGFHNTATVREFISCLDGYYRLMENFHHHLCREIKAPQMFDQQQKYYVHGPVSNDWAKRRLIDRNRRDAEVNYMLRQKSKEVGDLVLVLLNKGGVIEYPLKRLSTAQFQLVTERTGEPIMDSLQELIAYYKQDNHKTIRLKKGVPVAYPFDSHLYLCRSSVRSESTVCGEGPLQHKAFISVVSSVELKKKLGEGFYTEVYKGYLEGSDHEKKKMAVKLLQTKANQLPGFGIPALQAMLGAVHKAAFWDCPQLVRVHAVCLNPPVKVLVDYCKFGPLDQFLYRRGTAVTPFHAISICEQISQAVLYLQDILIGGHDLGNVHGNIRCHNVLVSDTKGGLKVKLSDPGLVDLFNSLPITDQMNYFRMPWLPPEQQHQSVYADRYALGITIWEVFKLREEPKQYDEMMAEVVRNGIRGRILPKLKTSDRDLMDTIEKINSIIDGCCNKDPEKRFHPRETVRSIREALANIEDENPYNLPEEPVISSQDSFVFSHWMNMDALPSPTSPSISQGTSCDSRCPLLTPTPNTPQAEVNAGLDTLGTNGASSIQGRALPAPPLAEADLHILRRQDISMDPNSIGTGHYGEVYKGWLRRKERVAVKTLKPSMEKEFSMEDFEKEFSLMVKLEHKNIIRMIGQCPPSKNSPMLLVMEFAEEDSLHKYVYKRRDTNSLSDSELLRFSKEIAEGMQYLHANRIVHRDLAARNVLVTKLTCMKISDFGLSRYVENDYYRAKKNRAIPALWVAPEALSDRKFTFKGDVWSYAITVWEVYSFGAVPELIPDGIKGGDFTKLVCELHDGRRLKRPERCPAKVYAELLMPCWKYDEEQRFNFDDVMKALEKLSG